MNENLKAYLLAQIRESSTWRGMIDIATALAIVAIVQLWTALPSEFSASLYAIALGFLGRGGIAVALPDRTAKGEEVKAEKVAEKAAAKLATGQFTWPLK